ncbi:uncharacterized protein APUU_31286S [Aspergillus puulaauensis]|uniref:Uncharacterized protein n=1 Tax=Aspergillus puulaauensis TaxID=1220207 RepID=A0A7R7XKD6_9EURO|nr:uncharacterized protein APUU_31286S [Aspergillus puulaauensis]BCS23061.1 hypothetical protein APUU_31286S [Aspergillus puulaauensis]
MSAPGNPWTNNETPDDAPFSERGFGLPPSPKPPAPGSTVSMKDGPDGGQIGSSSADKDGDQPPLKPTADATEGNKDGDDEGQIKPFFLEMGGDTPTTGSQRNKGKGKDNAGKGDDESQEQPPTVVTDERMPKIAAIPSKDSASVMPARPPPFDGGRLASSIPGSVASRVKALDDTMPLRPARPSMDFTKDSAPGPSAARLSIGSEKMPSSIPKDSPPSSTNSTVPPAPSSVTSVGISDKAPGPEPTLSRNPSPLPSPRGSVQSDNDGGAPGQSHKSGQGGGSSYIEDPALYYGDASSEQAVPGEPTSWRTYMPPDSDIELPSTAPNSGQYGSDYKEDPAPYCRDPSPEQGVPREPSNMSPGRMWTPPSSHTKMPCIPPKFGNYGCMDKEDVALYYKDPSPEKWEAYRGKGGDGVEDKLPSAPHETDSLQPEPTFHDLYDESPQESQSHSPHTTDRPGPGSQESGPNIQPSSDTPPQNGERKFTSLNNQCEECASVRKTISSCVPEIYLRCPPDMHPVMLKFTIWGSVVDASQIAMSLTRYLYTSGPPGVRVNAAVRRAASATHREGRWPGFCVAEIFVFEEGRGEAA